ncbi:putative procyclic form surface glycoprotein [Trypanosoma theileri]|uniref:Putative procyclic form surface glycoprotein n=1 Tax=Trypanosoma theileri TaxID=67003 RepID=A0A1X0P288_9TRYP|nr:putative procyclic form surface glycoprotein [Trypanosoma theileri]ORC90510.1 putative procyclic form surface glycoprotein [Trypanosoma theileri]
MCCCDVIATVGKYLKFVVAVVIFLFIAGAALIIVGSVFLSQKDGRKEFKAAVKNFNPTPIQAWTGTINDSTATVYHVPLNVDGMPNVISVFTEATVQLKEDSKKKKSTPLSVDLFVNISTVQNFTRSVTMMQSKSPKYTCIPEDCFPPGSECTCKAALATFENDCLSNEGEFDKGKSKCGLSDICGTCSYTKYISTVYLVATEIRPGVFSEHKSMYSAKYDFGKEAHDYTAVKPSSVAVRLYSDKDPFIALQRLTKGTGDFGVNRRTAGITMVVLGCLLLLLEIGVCVALICYCVRRKSKPANNRLGLPTTSNGAVTNSGGYMTPSGYGQSLEQPPVYGQLAVPPPPPAAAAAAPQGYGYGHPLAPLQGYVYGQPQVYFYGQPLATQGFSTTEEAPPQYSYGDSLSQPTCTSSKDVDSVKK